ncbi:HEPN domain-containing protein [Rhizobium sp. NFR07]|nr:HEPN domain-containing protein [Rhizobium sp. NFR07]SFB59653.1 HEPN domain-containing protein [Rhizobium sp. NFR07]
MFSDRLDHLPEKKRTELKRALKILFDEFEEAQNGKQRTGHILKVMLFGSYARGDWVEDRRSGYRSDYDLLIVVDIKTWDEQHEVWHKVAEHFLRELTITRNIETPVNFIVHTLQEVNDKLASGKPFFVDIARDGIMLYEAMGHPLAKQRVLDAEGALAEAQDYYDQWFPSAQRRLALAEEAVKRGFRNEAAFDLHQTTEKLYHCVLLVLTRYSPKSHRLKVLRSAAERVEPKLIEAWPRDTRFARRCFDRLDRAYVDARYSTAFSVTDQEINFIVERIYIFLNLVREVCVRRLSGVAGNC